MTHSRTEAMLDRRLFGRSPLYCSTTTPPPLLLNPTPPHPPHFLLCLCPLLLLLLPAAALLLLRLLQGVDLCVVPSEACWRLAKKRGLADSQVPHNFSLDVHIFFFIFLLLCETGWEGQNKEHLRGAPPKLSLRALMPSPLFLSIPQLSLYVPQPSLFNSAPLHPPPLLLRSLPALCARVPGAQLRMHGLPLRRGFWAPETRPKDAVRRAVGLKEGLRTTLVVGGGDGMGGIKGVTDALGEVCLCVAWL